MPDNVNFLSLYWSLLCLIGAIGGVWVYQQAKKDRRSVVVPEDLATELTDARLVPLVKLQSLYALWCEVIRFSIQLVGLAVGIYSMYIPPLILDKADAIRLHEPSRIIASGLTVGALLFIEHGQVALILLDVWRRRKAEQLAAEWNGSAEGGGH